MGTLSLIIAIIASTEIIGPLSDVFRSLLPALLLVPMFIFHGRNFDWENGLFWLMFTGAVLVSASISAVLCRVDELRSLVLAFACITPLAFLSFSFDSNDPFMERYLQGIAMVVSGLVLYLATQADSSRPTMLFEASLGKPELSMTWPALVGFSRMYNGWYKGWLLFLVAATIVAICLIFSRMALVTTVACLAVLFARRSKALFLILAGLVFLALVSRPELFRELLEWYRFADFEPDASRGTIRAMAWEIIQDNPWWGVGAGNIRYFLHADKPLHAHNTVMTAWLEYGVVGGALVFSFLVYVGSLAVRLWRHGGLGRYFALSLATWLATSLVEDLFHKPGAMLLFVAFLSYSRVILQDSGDEDYEMSAARDRMPSFESVRTSEDYYALNSALNQRSS
ncbi:MAG: O-antigen ligase family protein, partial [Ignavibacteriales bacterium]|nr:O-antigen ligase family protein [Ignavibacteriales bacterium]